MLVCLFVFLVCLSFEFSFCLFIEFGGLLIVCLVVCFCLVFIWFCWMFALLVGCNCCFIFANYAFVSFRYLFIWFYLCLVLRLYCVFLAVELMVGGLVFVFAIGLVFMLNSVVSIVFAMYVLLLLWIYVWFWWVYCLVDCFGLIRVAIVLCFCYLAVVFGLICLFVEDGGFVWLLYLLFKLIFMFGLMCVICVCGFGVLYCLAVWI